MPFEPHKINKEHVLKAIQKIEKQKLKLDPSIFYSVLVDGKLYPPKEVMRYAHQEMNGEYMWNYAGGEKTNKFLKALGFTIVEKASSSVAGAESSAPAVSFFNKEEIEFYSRTIETDATYRKDNPDDVKIAKRIKTEIFDKANYWVKIVCEQLADFEYEEDNAWNVSGNIKRYSWARLFLRGQRQRKFFVTVGVSAKNKSLVYKFDCQRDGGSRLHDNEIELFDSFAKTNKRDWQEIHVSSIEIYDWKSLTTRTVDFINQNLEAFKTLHGLKNNTDGNLKTIHTQMNTILYGPPGTGKTYNTIDKAVSIANSSFDFSGRTRDEIKKEYDRLLGLGRINFVTFHQSLSYEDFVEGIKPKTLKDQVVYEVEDGVFKAFCNKARFINGNFDEVIEKFKTDISESDGKPPLRIKAQGTTFDITYRGTNVFYVQPMNTTKENPWYPVNIENIRKAFETDSFEKIYNPTYVRETISHLKKKYGLVKGNAQPSIIKENYVFIIDEINRGNVSQIFGELITLIESDKREDQPEALEIQLPYSKELFSVPDNVYILGTMNTADRSVEALDTALRRRFSFEFMPPDPSQIRRNGKEITVREISLMHLLDTVNERIAYLLDEDHQIGHAYFCSLEQDNEVQLKQVFKNKIIPLLREFFYNDHAKIRMILGDGFVKKSIAKPKFAVKDEEDFVTDKSSYTIADIDREFDIVGALKETLHGKA